MSGDGAPGAPSCPAGPPVEEGLRLRLHQEAPVPLDAELDCEPGELVALIGPSGSGKSTILRCIAGLERPARGRVVCGQQVWLDTERGVALSPQARRVGLVFQSYALFPHMDALGNVATAVPDRRRVVREARARELLRIVHLEGLERRRPEALSGGQQQRVAVARALAREPRVLLLDEPFSAVDRMTRGRLQRELARLRARIRTPIVFVTHDLEEASALADRLVVLHRGRTLQSGPPGEVLARPRSATVARLVGQTNLFRGRLLRPAQAGGEGEGCPGRIEWAGGTLEVARTGAFRPGEELDWMIPGSGIVMHRRGRPSRGERENPVQGRALEVLTLGETTTVSLELGVVPGQTLDFTMPTHAARRNGLARGVAVRVSLLADAIHLMPRECG